MLKLAYLTVALVGLVFASPAGAVDLTQSLKTMDGSDFVGPDQKPLGLTYQTVIESALLSAQAANPDEKTQNFFLAMKVHGDAKNFEPRPEDILRIKKALGETQVTAVYGQVMSALDPTFLKGLK